MSARSPSFSADLDRFVEADNLAVVIGLDPGDRDQVSIGPQRAKLGGGIAERREFPERQPFFRRGGYNPSMPSHLVEGHRCGAQGLRVHIGEEGQGEAGHAQRPGSIFGEPRGAPAICFWLRCGADTGERRNKFDCGYVGISAVLCAPQKRSRPSALPMS